MPEESPSWILLWCRVAPSQGRPDPGGSPANSRQLFEEADGRSVTSTGRSVARMTRARHEIAPPPWGRSHGRPAVARTGSLPDRDGPGALERGPARDVPDGALGPRHELHDLLVVVQLGRRHAV